MLMELAQREQQSLLLELEQGEQQSVPLEWTRRERSTNRILLLSLAVAQAEEDGMNKDI